MNFTDFWLTYPRRVGKRAAELAFTKALKRGAEAEAIVEGAQTYRDDPYRTPEYTAYPATWLNGDRWLDEAALSSMRSEVEDLTLRFEDEPEGISFSEWLREHASDEEREKARRLGLGANGLL